MKNTSSPNNGGYKRHIIIKGSVAHEILDKLADLHTWLNNVRDECKIRNEMDDVSRLNVFITLIQDNFSEYLETEPTDPSEPNKELERN